MVSGEVCQCDHDCGYLRVQRLDQWCQRHRAGVTAPARCTSMLVQLNHQYPHGVSSQVRCVSVIIIVDTSWSRDQTSGANVTDLVLQLQQDAKGEGVTLPTACREGEGSDPAYCTRVKGEGVTLPTACREGRE